ncbi:hypothetical protein MATL_G00183700 [Megalops atlanticus]|uniref:Bromodomain adjacent to zinc finger domain protein 2B n=1 Tax=Megalops atlanticus TaxID=7932 RepID=A0A9D3T2L3_MEGAT|nr:hypothetical protein MATL_G00183700 [Megalops atlanticus]
MESGEQLASSSSSSSASPSAHAASRSSAVSPAPPAAKSPLVSGQTPLGSPLTTCGHLFRQASDQTFSMSAVSSAFPTVSHPAFGLYTTSTGRSEFGGLGTLGVSAALAAHPQLGAFPEWWRAAEAHGRGAASFFPSLLGLPPMFTTTLQNHESDPYQTRTPSKNGQGPQKGGNSTVNGNSVSASSRGSSSSTVSPALGTPGQAKAANSSSRGRKGNQDNGKAQDKPAQKTKDKKLCKKAAGISSNSESESGSSSDTSSDGASSSGSEDLEEDDDDDEEDQSNESEDSDSDGEARGSRKEKVMMQGVSEGRKDCTKAAEEQEAQERKSSQPQSFPAEPPVLSHCPSQPSLQGSKPRGEAMPHLSVIQSTGLVPGTKPPPTRPGGEGSPKAPPPTANPLSLCPSPKPLPLSLSPSPKPPSLSPVTKPKSLAPSPKPLALSTLPDEPPSHISDFRLKQAFLPQEKFQQAFSLQLKRPQESPKAHKKTASSSSLPPPKLYPETPHNNHAHPFLLGPLLAPGPTPASSAPVNLSTGSRKLPASSTSPTPPRRSRTPKATPPGKATPPTKATSQSHLARSLVDLFRGTESDIPSSRDSDDSIEEEDDEDEEEEEDSDDSLSESESNLESDSDVSEDDVKDRDGTGTDTEGERTPLKLTKSASLLNASSSGLSPSCSPLNLMKTPGSASSAAVTSSGSLAYHSTPSSSYALCTPPGSGKRKRELDERELRLPLQFGWQRETRIRNLGGRLQGDVAYYAPCGKKLRQYPDVVKGVQWSLLRDEEVIPRLLAMEVRRGRPSNSERQQPGDDSSPRGRRRKGRPPNVGEGELPSAASAKLLRKLEAQEIARQAAEIKLMRKLERQALARAAKEARKQQAIMAAEEKRKQKEQIKILKQQEKIKRIQQIRMEKELRAQQILEAKRKKKEEAANAKILEAEKRIKEKEMRRQQAVILKHQELERHRLDMERERRRQHMMLMKAMEARKKAEERERLKQEKRDEKRLNKERKLELKRLEVEIAREMKKPNEDMCLADHKPLPELSRVTGLVLPYGSFSDCLMVMQFLRSFGKVLGFDVGMDVPSLGVLQEGLLNVGESMGEVQDLLVRLLSAVVCDPGLPPGHRTKTAMGDHLTNVGINRDNVSEILQIYMEAHCGGTELAELTESLKTKAFQAHTPAQKASILAFLVNELACSKSVVSEIDKNIDHMTNLRRDKWTIEGKLRKLRIVHAKRTGKKDTGVAGEETQALGTPASGRKRKRKGGDSDEDEDEDSDEQGDEDEDEEEEGVKRGKKGDVCEDEDEGDQAASVEELEKQIEKMTKQQSQIRRKLFEASHSLRSMPFGQDRYKRRYWVLPQCGGVFVEGMENAEGPEEAEKERERGRSAEAVQVKEEPAEVPEEKPLEISLGVSIEGEAGKEAGKEKDPPNLFLQKPGSFSKLSQLLEAAKMSPEQDTQPQKQNGGSAAASPPATSPGPHGDAQTPLPSSPQPAPPQLGAGATPDPAAPLPGPPPLLPGDQLLRVLTEKGGHWPKSPSSSPTHLATSASSSPHNPMGLNNFALSALQLKPGMNLMGLPFCGWPSLMNPNLPFSGGSLPSVLGLGYPSAEGNGNPFLAPSISTSKSESPVPPSEKPPSAASPAVEVPKPQDYPSPRPIPEEMLVGWWKVADTEELRSLVKALHCRGVREKVLQKQIQKYMEYIAQACAKNRDVSAIDVTDMEENQVTAETVESWCVEEQAMEVDIAVLQQVEELERKVTSASLQVKGWIYPEPQSEREDLVYHEHKPVTKQGVAGERDAGPEREGAESGSVARRVNNPLDIAVTRLADLERNIERRYLKTPLGGEEEAAPGMKVWRKALSDVRSSAQLALCLQQLQKSIAWERSIMKVYCQICRKGDNEELLLLCDGCDKGCHTYCHRPKISSIPEGDWFCPACISKASNQSPKNKKQPNKTGAGGAGGGAAGGVGGAAGVKKSSEVKRSKKPPAVGEVSEDDSASTSGTPKKGAKEAKKKKGEESPSVNPPRQESPAGGKTTPRDNSRDLALCSTLLSELEGHQDAWPFLTPVNPKSVPGYKKVIKKPMDFSTIREKLCCNHYQNLETFIIDVNLVFDNCEKFNEDNSDIGRAGHNMRKFFEKRWTDLLKTS